MDQQVVENVLRASLLMGQPVLSAHLVIVIYVQLFLNASLAKHNILKILVVHAKDVMYI